MMSLLRLALLFATLLGMALLTAPDHSAATPVTLDGPLDGEAHIAACEETSLTCERRRDLCRECVHSCWAAAAHSSKGKHAYFLAELCRTRGGAGISRSDAR